MNELVFLLEERSMQEVLQVVVPALVPEAVVCRFIPHEGKKDLEKSIPRKLRAWRTPGVQFVVVRDKDSSDCRVLKQKLAKLCKEGQRPETMVRIVCHHLESWFLGDLSAVETAYGLRGISDRQGQKKFVNPDDLSNAEEELRRLVPHYQKVGGSRRIAPHLNIDRNRSHSFGVFIKGIRQLVEQGPGRSSPETG